MILHRATIALFILCVFNSAGAQNLSTPQRIQLTPQSEPVAGEREIPLMLADAAATTPKSGSAVVSQQDQNMFRTLDQETELLLQEILNLSSDISIISEEDDGSQQHQITVLVTSDPTKLFDLAYVELKVDKQTVAAYQYTDGDVNAMLLGGGHRLYKAHLPAGIHKISAFMLGSVPRDPAYKREVSYHFIAGISRTVLELNIDSQNNTTYPILVVKEWN